MANLDLDKIYSAEDAAQFLGIHYVTALRYCKRHQIRGVRIGHKWMIPGREIARVRTEGTDPIGGAA